MHNNESPQGVAIIAPRNNEWHHLSATSPVVVIFVHGYFSNSASCWTNSNGIFWPDLVLNDLRIGEPSIYMAGYYTSIDSADYDISDCADEIFAAITRRSPTGEMAPIDYDNIVFVCHSLGGIVTRYMLEARHDAFTKKSVGLVLMASPSLGSTYADLFEFLAQLYKNKLGKQLKRMNESLINLDKRFRSLLGSNRIRSLVGSEAVEHKSLFGWRWLPPLKPIVETWSASRYFGDSRKLPGTDHSSIVKPDDMNHPGHTFLVDFFNKTFNKTIQNNQQVLPAIEKQFEISKKTQKPDAELVLFDILGKENIPYYLTRSFDKTLSSHLALRSVWLTGSSGCGKTSAIRYLLETQKRKPLDICLSHCNSETTRDQYIFEIVATANQLEIFGINDRPITYQALVALLSDYSAISSIVLHLDEVAVGGGMSNSVMDLLNLICDLLNSVKQRSGRSDLRFVISSINKPTITVEDNREKLAEFIKFIDVPSWSTPDLALLLNLIIKYIPAISLSDSDKRVLIHRCHGSPRFLKRCLRNHLLAPPQSADIHGVISETEHEIVM